MAGARWKTDGSHAFVDGDVERPMMRHLIKRKTQLGVVMTTMVVHCFNMRIVGAAVHCVRVCVCEPIFGWIAGYTQNIIYDRG